VLRTNQISNLRSRIQTFRRFQQWSHCDFAGHRERFDGPGSRNFGFLSENSDSVEKAADFPVREQRFGSESPSETLAIRSLASHRLNSWNHLYLLPLVYFRGPAFVVHQPSCPSRAVPERTGVSNPACISISNAEPCRIPNRKNSLTPSSNL
jgi:hypothetical protein